jgi:hypothetical protein
MPDTADRMTFSLTWLAGAAAHEPQLAICDHGCLVIRGNTHWQPVAFAATGKSLICEMTTHGPDQAAR